MRPSPNGISSIGTKYTPSSSGQETAKQSTSAAEPLPGVAVDAVRAEDDGAVPNAAGLALNAQESADVNDEVVALIRPKWHEVRAGSRGWERGAADTRRVSAICLESDGMGCLRGLSGAGRGGRQAGEGEGSEEEAEVAQGDVAVAADEQQAHDDAAEPRGHE